jgi:GNAT superfamily N-acetyltransferase
MDLRGYALRAMAVSPERQRQGIGTRLLRVVQAEVDTTLWCNARVDAVGFYARLGWLAVGPVFEIEHHGNHQRMTWTVLGRGALRS